MIDCAVGSHNIIVTSHTENASINSIFVKKHNTIQQKDDIRCTWRIVCRPEGAVVFCSGFAKNGIKNGKMC
jgi:hypothetical protein